jgi:manganese-dependent inorganic pyrophosphatase
VKGIEKAEITEIVDHHRLGGLETEQPITTHIKPVGCTSTIIWELFKTQNITPPKSIMGAMLSAILSDTVLLRSPTTTQEDIMAVSEIGGELNLDVMEYGMKMYGAKSDLKGISISRMINMDRKEFHTSKGRIAVSQIEVVDSSSIIKRHEEILAEMEKTAEVRGYYLFALMITDILKESSDILACGETKLIEKAFHKKFEDHRIHLEGVVSRKKQVIPKILRYL